MGRTSPILGILLLTMGLLTLAGPAAEAQQPPDLTSGDGQVHIQPVRPDIPVALASGAAIPRPGLEELVNQADLIVVGRVDTLNSYWSPEHTHIFTNVGVSAPTLGAADFTLQDPIPELYSFFGGSVATGDVNGDGKEDVIVGAPASNAGTALLAGQAFVFLGGQPFDPAADFTLEDPLPDEDGRFGCSVAAADVNDDGKDDVIVGARRSDADGEGSREGQAFVFLGGDPFDATADFTLQDPHPITGLEGSFGNSVARGDVNGDGKDDVIVTADFYTWEAFVFLGGDPFDAVADFTLSNPDGFEQYFGSAVAAGDVNGDLKDDVVVGAENGGESSRGEAFVFLGGDPFDATADFTLQAPSPQFPWPESPKFGYAVGAWDVTGDAKADVIVGAPWSDTWEGLGAGEAIVFAGGDPFDAASDFTLQDPTPTTNGMFGKSLAAGDIDGDGKNDFIVGARNSGPSNGGKAYVFLGGSPFDATSDVTLQDPNPEYLAGFGYSVAAGDVNGDGFDDAIVGAHTSDVGDQEDAGEAFVFLGGTPTPTCDPGVDTDNDGFDNDVECYLGTDPLDDCPDDEFDDAWPPDMDNDAWADVGDILEYKPVIMTTVPPSSPRYDLDMEQNIDVGDILMYKPVIITECEP